MSNIRLFTVLSGLFWSCLAAAVDTHSAAAALAIYQQTLSQYEEGVYLEDERVFVIADQACLREQKYSGTQESKKATAEALARMTQYLLESQGKLSRNEISLPGALGDDSYQLYQQQQSRVAQSMSGSGYRILDADMGDCRRRVVYAIPEQAFASVKHQLHARPDLQQLQQKTFATALRNKNYTRIAEYFDALKLSELAMAFSLKQPPAEDILFEYPVMIQWHQQRESLLKDVQHCSLEGSGVSPDTSYGQLAGLANTAFCGGVVNVVDTGVAYLHGIATDAGRFADSLSAGDQQHLVRLVLRQQGFVVFTPLAASENVQSLNRQAMALFNKGADAPEIVRLYSLSLNINPAQPEVWSQLGSVFKAFGQDGAASALFMQALLQQPENMDYWLKLSGSLQKLDRSEQGQRLQKTASELSSLFTISAWGRDQLVNNQ